MPATGGEPRQLSDQKHPDFAFHVFAAGDAVLATSRKDVLRVTLPDGPVTAGRGHRPHRAGAVGPCERAGDDDQARR